jgi:hypothetical protein
VRTSENKDIDVARVWVSRGKEPKTLAHLTSERSGFENIGAAAARSELRVGETLVFESSMCRREDGKHARWA